MDLSILRCVAVHLCAQTSMEQPTVAISFPGLRRRESLARLRQPLALEPIRTIPARDHPMRTLRTGLGAVGEQCSSPHCVSSFKRLFSLPEELQELQV